MVGGSAVAIGSKTRAQAVPAAATGDAKRSQNCGPAGPATLRDGSNAGGAGGGKAAAGSVRRWACCSSASAGVRMSHLTWGRRRRAAIGRKAPRASISISAAVRRFVSDLTSASSSAGPSPKNAASQRRAASAYAARRSATSAKGTRSPAGGGPSPGSARQNSARSVPAANAVAQARDRGRYQRAIKCRAARSNQGLSHRLANGSANSQRPVGPGSRGAPAARRLDIGDGLMIVAAGGKRSRCRAHSSMPRLAMARSQVRSGSSAKTSETSAGMTNQTPCSSSPSNWPGLQPA